MRKLLLIILVTFWGMKNGNAALNLDSLNIALAQMPADTTSLRYMNQLFEKHSNESYEVKLAILQWTALVSKKIHHYEMEGKTFHTIAKLMLDNGDQAKASQLLTAALKLAEKYELHELAGRIHNTYGVMYYDFGELDDAIDNYEKAVYYAHMSPSQKGMGGYYANLASVYFQLADNLDSARTSIEMMKTAMVCLEEEKDTLGYIAAQSSLILMYMHMGDLDSAQKSLENNYKWILDSRRERDLIFHYVRKSELLILREEYNEAADVLEEGMVYVEKFHDEQWRLIYYEHFRVIYSALKNYELAYSYSDKYITASNSLRSVEVYAESKIIEEKYNTEKKEKEILRLNKDYEISQLKLAHEQNEKFIFKVLMVAAFVILLLLFSIVIILARISKSRKEFIKILEKKNSEIQEQSIILNEKSKQLTRYQCQMNPHFVFNALNTIQGSVMNDNKQKTMDQLHVLGTLMRETMTISQKDLIPLNEEVNYLNRYVYFEQSRLSKKIAFNLDLPEHMESILIPPMLLQPVIENAVKHGGFNRIDTPAVSLKVIEQEDCLEIVVEDNGFGFDTQNTAYMKPAHAMEIIHSRLQIIWESLENTTLHNPFLELISKPQLKNGTSCKLVLPLVYKY